VTDTSDEARDLKIVHWGSSLSSKCVETSECCQASFAFSYNYGLELGWWSFMIYINLLCACVNHYFVRFRL
jgi:hypothetical protein